ncbi:MAG: type II toxin-antitoxin system HicA family toxin [Selenomonadaceae bacterium]|nr:type II toxin-antitoxin system HicA family toxin [Selenomonadaceae bacterium]
MTWAEVIRKITKKGARFKEHDKKHDVYWNPKTGAEVEIPRHSSKEAPTGTVHSILRKLNL